MKQGAQPFHRARVPAAREVEGRAALSHVGFMWGSCGWQQVVDEVAALCVGDGDLGALASACRLLRACLLDSPASVSRRTRRIPVRKKEKVHIQKKKRMREHVLSVRTQWMLGCRATVSVMAHEHRSVLRVHLLGLPRGASSCGLFPVARCSSRPGTSGSCARPPPAACATR